MKFETRTESHFFWPEPTLVLPPSFPRRALVGVGTAIAAALGVHALRPTPVNAQEVRALPQKGTDYNDCNPSPHKLTVFGNRLTSYCTNVDGDYTHVLKPDLLDTMKKFPATNERPFVHGIDPILDFEENLAIQFHIYWNKIADPKESCQIGWLVGDLSTPYGMFETDWFSERLFRQINYIYAHWENRLLHQMDLLDSQSENIQIPQRFRTPKEILEQSGR